MFPIERFSKGKCNGKDIVTVCAVCEKLYDPMIKEWLSILLPDDPDEVSLSHSYCPPCAQASLEAALTVLK